MKPKMKPIAFVFLVLAPWLVAQPALAAEQSCTSWQGVRPYLQKYFAVDGAEKDNLVATFNAAFPRTNFHPDRVGYAWYSGLKVVRLFMMKGDCVVLDRHLPRQAVWRMMSGSAPSADMDKSGARAQALLERYNAALDKAWQRRQQAPLNAGVFDGVDEDDMSEDDAILNQDIN